MRQGLLKILMPNPYDQFISQILITFPNFLVLTDHQRVTLQQVKYNFNDIVSEIGT